MLRIELPLPAKELSPNARVHWQVRAKATREAKEQVIATVLSQRPRGTPLTSATVTVTFVVGDRRRRDLGNYISSAKSYLDGLIDAGIIWDDSWETITEVYPPIRYEKGVRCTIIEVEQK